MSEHYVRHVLMFGDWVKTQYECREPEKAPCRTICRLCESDGLECCQCEYQDPPRIPEIEHGIKCMYVDWLRENPEECFDGDDSTPVRGPDWQLIIITWNGDSYDWDYAPEPEAVDAQSS